MNAQEKRRKEVALALMLKDGHQPEDIGDWRKSVYAKKADEFIEQHTEDGLCPKCQGTGFTEQEHGLFRAFCDCEKGKALQAEVTGETEVLPAPDGSQVLSSDGWVQMEDETVIPPEEVTISRGVPDREVLSDSDSGTGQPDSPVGSADTSKPKQPKKPKTKKKARARTG